MITLTPVTSQAALGTKKVGWSLTRSFRVLIVGLLENFQAVLKTRSSDVSTVQLFCYRKSKREVISTGNISVWRQAKLEKIEKTLENRKHILHHYQSTGKLVLFILEKRVQRKVSTQKPHANKKEKNLNANTVNHYTKQHHLANISWLVVVVLLSHSLQNKRVSTPRFTSCLKNRLSLRSWLLLLLRHLEVNAAFHFTSELRFTDLRSAAIFVKIRHVNLGRSRNIPKWRMLL